MTPRGTAGGIAQFFEQLSHTIQHRETAPLTVQLGCRVVDLYPCCPELRTNLTGHFSHLTTPHTSDSEIFLVDGHHAEEVAPRISWPWMGWKYGDEAGFAQFLAHSQSMLVRTATGNQVAYVSRGGSAAHWLTRENTRLSMQWILGFLGVDAIHGGTLGRGERGVLLTGRGGSGKSTLVAAGVHSGFTTLGEDFLLLGENTADDHPRLHSFFSSGKLEPSSPAHQLYQSQGHSSDGKTLVALDEADASLVIPQQKIVAAVCLSVSHETTVVPANVDQLREALLPHSAPLNLFPQRMAQTVSETLENLPIYSMTSGPILRATLDIIDEMISA